MRIRLTAVFLAAILGVMTDVLVSQQLPAPSPPGIKFSKVIGWPAGRTPAAPAGFDVSAFAEGLDNPAVAVRAPQRRRAGGRVQDRKDRR